MKNSRLTCSNLYIPSKQSMLLEQKRHYEFDRLGIDISTFSNKKIDNKDELIAMKYILDNKPVPTEIEKRLLETKEQRKINNIKKDTSFNIVTDADIAQLLHYLIITNFKEVPKPWMKNTWKSKR